MSQVCSCNLSRGYIFTIKSRLVFTTWHHHRNHHYELCYCFTTMTRKHWWTLSQLPAPSSPSIPRLIFSTEHYHHYHHEPSCTSTTITTNKVAAHHTTHHTTQHFAALHWSFHSSSSTVLHHAKPHASSTHPRHKAVYHSALHHTTSRSSMWHSAVSHGTKPHHNLLHRVFSSLSHVIISPPTLSLHHITIIITIIATSSAAS